MVCWCCPLWGQEFSLPLPAAGVAYQVDAEQVIEVAPSMMGAAGLERVLQVEPITPDGLLFSTFLGGVFEDVGRASAIDYADQIW